MNKDLTVFSADIHIHTPASKCYKGNKKDDEYFNILSAAKKKNLSVIAISDHNSIEGYSILFEQKRQIETEIQTLKSLNDSVQAQQKLKELHIKIKLFEGILIIPAVEFEVNNGVHLLVLFNPTTSVNKIKLFLEKGGYNSESFGHESSKTISNWSIFDLYTEIEDYDCLIIDGHTDSDKGIWNTIPKGNTRAHAFKNSSLAGVCYKSESQRNQLELILKNSPEYQRENGLAFLKSSDAHNLNEIGTAKSYFKLEKLDWTSFKKAFENPIEYIFTNYPKFQDIIDNILRNEQYLTIPDIKNKEAYLKSICALNNTDGGYILIGVDDKNTIHGLEYPNNDNDKYISLYINFIFDGINELGNMVRSDFNFYPLQEEKIIIVVKIFQGERLIDIEGDGVVFSYNNKKIIRLGIDEVQNKIENSTIRDIENKIEKSLAEIDKQTSIIKSSIKSLPIISSYINNSTSLYLEIENLNLIKPLKLNFQEQQDLKVYFSKNGNGKSKGNIFFFEELQSPRLNDTYLRLSIPKFFSKNLSFKSENIETLYIIPGGGVFYSKRTLPHFNPMGLPILQLHMNKESGYSIKFVCAFLKSSFFLWFMLNRHEQLDILKSNLFKGIRLPKLNFKNPNVKSKISSIEKEFDIIIQQEQDFLKMNSNADNYVEIIKNHNLLIDACLYKTDGFIFELLELDTDTIKLVENNLEANQIYIPAGSKEINS